ncbi:hypothetical protein BDV93DRAFT_519851 [Ceratobasidium sp. AG-I]|nr:hypothetical protein BDV93DRAFT_519851 [Ceratobasidium sp. AG-I]
MQSRYVFYKKTKPEIGWLDSLKSWETKADAEVKWVPEFRWGAGNVAEHTMVPMLFCSLHIVPNEYLQRHLRRAAGNSRAAEAAAKEAACRWINEQNQTQNCTMKLESFYCTVKGEGPGSHNRYVASDISYVCRLERWVVAGCAGKGSSKSKAMNHAAQQLIMAEKYCMLDLSKTRRK